MAKIFALTAGTTKDYILRSQVDDPKEDQIVWKLKMLSAKEQEFLENKLGSIRDGNFDIHLGTQNRVALDMGLEGVENFQDINGNEVELTRSNKKMSGLYYPLNDEFVAMIPKAIRQELAQAIMNDGELTEEDVKNS